MRRSRWNHGSVSAAGGVPKSDRRYYWFILPCWLAALLFGALPAHCEEVSAELWCGDIARHEDDPARECRLLLRQPREERRPVEPRHLEVADDQVVVPLPRQPQALLPGADRFHGMLTPQDEHAPRLDGEVYLSLKPHKARSALPNAAALGTAQLTPARRCGQ